MRLTQKPVISKLAAYTKLYIISYDVDVDSSNALSINGDPKADMVMSTG